MEEKNIPNHIGIIMDGNRRWAKANNLETALGHKKGAEVLENISKYCNNLGLKYLTVYAFSTENWKRTEAEVTAIMVLMQKYLERFLGNENLHNIRLKILGDLDALNSILRNKIIELENKTKDNTGLQLNIAFNYGGRDEIIKAVKKIANDYCEKKIDINDLDEEMFSNYLYTKGIPDPELIIRTSGETRTSNFLPWQTTYSEFLFLEKYWPDFNEGDIDKAIEIYQNRKIRKGK